MAMQRDEGKAMVACDGASSESNREIYILSQSDSVIDAICEDLRQQNLESITLKFLGTCVNFQKVCDTLKHIKSLKNLQIELLHLQNCTTVVCNWPLDISSHLFSDKDLLTPVLSQDLMNNLFAGFVTLEHLAISKTDFSAADLSVFTQMQSLKSLDLRQCCLSFTSISTLLDALCRNHNSIVELDIRDNFVLCEVFERFKDETTKLEQRKEQFLGLLLRALCENSCLHKLLCEDRLSYIHSDHKDDSKSDPVLFIKKISIAESLLWHLIQQQLVYNNRIWEVEHTKLMHDAIVDLINAIKGIEAVPKQESQNKLLDETLDTFKQQLTQKIQELTEICNALESAKCYNASYYIARALDVLGQYKEALTLYLKIPPGHQHFDEARHAAMMLILDEAKLPSESIPNSELPPRGDSADPRLQRFAAAIQVGLEAALANGEHSYKFTAKLMEQYVQDRGLRRSDLVQHIISPDTIKTPISIIMQLLASLRQALPQHVQQVDAPQALNFADSAATPGFIPATTTDVPVSAPAAMPAAAPVIWSAVNKRRCSIP